MLREAAARFNRRSNYSCASRRSGSRGKFIRPLVTALINTYNYGHFVEQAIDSVLGQDYPGGRVEIVVVDDGSTDDTSERVKKYGSRVQYFKKPNGGQASAFNLGFQMAKGEVIALLDADDYWLPGKLSRVARAFEEMPRVGLVYHRRTEMNSETGKSAEGNFAECRGYLPENIEKLLEYRVMPTSSLSFSHEVLARMMPMPEVIRLQADAYLALVAVFLAPVASVPENLSVYRLHGKNLHASGLRDAAKAQEHFRMRKVIFAEAKKWLGEHGFDANRDDVRVFFGQLDFFLASDEFVIKPPGRIEFFQHLRRQNRLYGRHQDWKLRAMNWCNTLAAAVVGYKRFRGMYQTEVRVLASMKRSRSRQA
jgi:glycosyltransferase involved in cell wall biosynthesis